MERTLSIGRDVISLRRESLKAETIRHLMLYKSFLHLERELNMQELDKEAEARRKKQKS